jgi:hypothetical protein
MLRAFVKGDYMSEEDAKQYDQRPFRSMLVQGWVRYYRGHGFRITHAGLNAWHEFRSTDIHRGDPTLPLTAYFNSEQYKLKHTLKLVHPKGWRNVQSAWGSTSTAKYKETKN